MIKKILSNMFNKLIANPKIAKFILVKTLKLHNFCYHLASRIATKLSDEKIHPKHRIIKYEEWFKDNIEPNWVVLDIGCSLGNLTAVISTKSSFVYGIEIVKKKFEQAIKNYGNYNNLEFFCDDATLFDYSNLKSIDCVTLSNVLEHIETRIDFLKKLKETVKWNNKKRFLIRVPMINRDWITIYKQELNLEYRLDKTHFIEYTKEIFAQEINEAGLKIISCDIRFGEIYAVCEE